MKRPLISERQIYKRCLLLSSLVIFLGGIDRFASGGEPALNLNHASALANMGTGVGAGLTDLTLEAWIRTSSKPGSGSYGSIAGRGYLAGANGFGLFTHNNGNLVFQTRTGSTTVSPSIPYDFDGQWRHIAGVRDGNDTRLYVNGELVDEQTGSLSSLDTTVRFALGQRDTGSWGFPFNGWIAEVRLWDHARTAATIQHGMPRRLTGSEPGLIGYWPLDEGAGSTVFDRSSGGKNGALSNTSWTDDPNLALWAPFAFVSSLTGRSDYTNTNELEIVNFPWMTGYDVYQITEFDAAPLDEPGSWIATNPGPTQIGFTSPAQATNVTLTVWFTNTAESVALRSYTNSIRYTQAQPAVVVHPTFEFLIVEGASWVTLRFEDLDNGSHGGEFDGEPMPFDYALGHPDDTTPEEPVVTLVTGGVYEVVLTMTNAAGNTAAATSTVTVLTREAHLYVSSAGDGSDGQSWAGAYPLLDTAFSNAVPGDTIHVAGEVFAGVAQGDTTLTRTVFLLRNATNLLVRGGYQADPDLPAGDHPGAHDPSQWPTVLTRTSGNCRVLSVSGSTNTVFEFLTISNGYEAVSSGTRYGGGIYLTGSREITFRDSRIVNNESRGNPCYGGAIYLAGSSLTLTNVLLSGNQLNAVHNGWSYGGAVYVDGNSRLTLAGSVLQDSWARGAGGGRGLGGGIYVDTGGILDIRESVLANNRARHGSSSGGAIHNLGTLTLRNALLAGNRCDRAHSDGIWMGGGSALLDNCTVADNHDVALRYGAGTVAVSNSIVWGHTVDLMNFPEDAGILPDVWYSCIGDGQNAGVQGCLSVDPLFADRIHYHLQSTEGHYTNGYFSGGFWTNAAANSPLIDRGDPAADYSREPEPNGERLNLGAYGNTKVAARTADLVVDPPAATNHGALAWGHRTVILRGEITDDGGEFCEAAFHYWEDGSTTTNIVPQGIKAQGEPFQITLSGLTPGTVYHYHVSASNRAAITFSSAEPFAMHPSASALYVATNGNHTAGTNWSTAYSDLQTALDIAEDGDVIYLAGGQTFSGSPGFGLQYVFLWSGVSNVTIRGGYAAADDNDLPGARDREQWPTVIARASGHARVLSLSGLSNCVIEQVTVRGGDLYVDSGTRYGGGIRLSACQDIVFSECLIESNRVRANPGYGGGIDLNNSTLTLMDCVMATNTIPARHNGNALGGAAYLNAGSRLTVLGSLIIGNQANGAGGGTGRGGAFYVEPGGVLTIRESVLTGSRSTRGTATGGAIDNRGTLAMYNCLLADNRSAAHSDGIFSGSGGSAVIVNCTVVDNFDVGIRFGTGSIALSNSIVVGHTVDLMDFPEDEGILPDVWYSCIGDGQNAGAQGCLSVDPLFTDRIHYHLQSTEGHYTNGYFSGGFWTHAAANSPLIDRGDPAADYSREPDPNGSRINMGAYGNTEVAAQTAVIEVDPPAATNHGALAWGHRTVILSGEIIDDGGEFSEAAFHYWLDGSAETNVLQQGVKAQNEPFQTTISGLIPGMAYGYRVSASNSEAITFSHDEMFVMHPPASALYVATNGHHTAGTNWSTAYNDLQTALDIAEDGDVIYLAGGQTFSGSPGFGLQYVFLWSGVSNVTIRGGYAAANDVDLPGSRDREQWPTVIARASGHARVLSLSGLSNCVIEQVTVRGGDLYVDSGTRYGGGIRLSACQDIVFSECRIESNRVRANPGYGGGIDLNNSTLTLMDCVMATNTIPARHNGSAFGGAAHVSNGSRLTVIRSHILDNQANGSGGGTGRGGAFYVTAGGILNLYESVLTGNRSTRNTPTGGAIDNRGTLTLRNCLLTDNRSDSHSDAILSTGASAWTLIESSTLADNHEQGIRYGDGVIALTNTIVWGHATADLVNLPDDGGILLNVSHCIFNDPSMDGVNGCIAADPRFIGDGDYRLRNAYGIGDPLETSPAIDAGINLPWMTGATDLDGAIRVMVGQRIGPLRVDIGAYESEPPRGTLYRIR